MMEKERDMKSVMKYYMEGEIYNFINLWILVCISLSYCYFAAKLVPKGGTRLLSILPVVCLFIVLPLKLQSIHLCGTTGFFLAFLANFKLLLLAFGHGPLSGPSVSLPQFLALACLPISIQKSYTKPSAQFQEKHHIFPQNLDPLSKSLEKLDLCHENGHSRGFQDDPNPKSLEKPQNGDSQEDPHSKFSEKSNLCHGNDHDMGFQQDPHSKSLEKSNLCNENDHDMEFQQDPSPKSLEKSQLCPQNDHDWGIQQDPNPKSLEKTQLYPQDDTHTNSIEKTDLYYENGNFQFQINPSFILIKIPHKIFTYAIKAIMLGIIIGAYYYSEHIHPTIFMFVYFLHMYFYLEVIQATVAFTIRAIQGVELEPQFNEPYFATSLQDFWGGRWNLMVSRILRPTVYNPALRLSARLVGRRHATFPAVVVTFAVSGLMHELLFYYLGRVKPTWEITWFFVLHGTCLAMEIAIKRALNGRFRPPKIFASILSVGFVMITGFWLFFPQLLRCQTFVKVFAEYRKINAFLMDLVNALTDGFGDLKFVIS